MIFHDVKSRIGVEEDNNSRCWHPVSGIWQLASQKKSLRATDVTRRQFNQCQA
jgi:hypothetical protein